MDLPPCGRGALVVPPSAAGIAGSRPGAMFWICRSSHGGFQFSALRAERLFTRPSGALQMCRLRQRRLPGPAPAGGPTSCAPKKSAEEGRSRGLPPVPLRNPREYLAITRRLPPLPMGTPAEGSIQVAGAPNTGTEGSATKERRPVGGAPLRFCRRISPKAFRVRFRRLSGRGIAPVARRLVGCYRLVRSSVVGRRRLWPQANRRRRWGRRGFGRRPSL